MKKVRNGIWMFVTVVLMLSFLPEISVKAAADPIINVKLKGYLGNKSEIIVEPEVTYTTNLANVKLESNKKYTLRVSGTEIVVLTDSKEVGKASEIEVKPETGNGPLSINGRSYLGGFRFIMEDGKFIRPFNSIGLEDYLKGVVPAEMPALWNQEALKAQAVAARTYAMGYINRTPDDTISYQVYGGYAWHENSTKAVKATEGQVIGYGDKLHIGSDALFSSSNGGKTESNKNVWGGTERPYLMVKDDPYDPQTVWSFSVKKQQIDLTNLDLTKADTWWANTKEAEQTQEISNIRAWLQTNGYTGNDIKITAVPFLSLHAPTSGGRVSKGSITIEFIVKEQGKALQQSVILEDVTASKIRAIIGLSFMKSYLVDKVDTTTDTINVSGKGFGHGVGLSQYGAKKAGEQGNTYRDILAVYYEGTSLKQAYKPEPEEVEPVKPSPAPVIPTPIPTPVPDPAPKDETAPTIKDIKTDYDSKTNQVKLTFDTNEKANVTVEVKDEKKQALASLVKGDEKPSGSQLAVWDASEVSNGSYTFEITTIDSSNNTSSASVPFTLTKPDTTAPVIKNTNTSYDSKTNKVFLKYEINEKAKVIVQVKDAKGKILATPINNVEKNAGVQWTSWNVSKVSNGKYSFEITTIDSSKNKSSETVPFTLTKPDISAPSIKNIKNSYDSKTNKVSLKYEINEKAKVTVQVKDAKSKTVATLTNNTNKNAGVQSASWDVSKVSNGKYTFTITAIDPSKNKRTTTTSYTLNKPASKYMTGKVNATKLNVRSKPSTSGKVLGSLKKNQTVTVITNSSSWYKIKYGKETGYVYGKYLTNVQ
ncbi:MULTISPECIES: SpoIID/LytB domain-containing protein [unclassified Bacillus (in: firmicutes)]|uniref:SpoIID/LytB domain-containing protein n=1 Tax=unclassified Bacillus (in: firmicutes) TaxID=185979 RepID=UPI001BEA9167|nr:MULTISPECIES: SpoIID/LytB domain-containing protein [unclassified Bacillus (in: firmicutes)]MBT2618986.1 SpoIID/LytB domain-containing protein [Bacillus sp. ISL-78]MBT2630648.1 SpoIID/LytB domain-containing protein [Bacillus sp. ISL-101]